MIFFKKHAALFIAICLMFAVSSISLNAENHISANIADIEIRNMPADSAIPADVMNIVRYYFSVRRQSLSDAFNLDNTNNTLLAKDNSIKSKINESILRREDERIYEVQRYYVLGSGTDYYADCDLDYHCDYYDHYTENGKLYVVVTEFIHYTEDDGTIATSVGIAHTMEFINREDSYFLNIDIYSDMDITGTKISENGIVTKGLLYPEVDLRTVISDPDYNKIDNNRKAFDNIRTFATYAPGLAVSYAMTYYGIPNYKNYKVLFSGGTLVDCANFVSQCLAAGNLVQKSAGTAYPWFYSKSSTVCTCSTFNPNHTCRNNDIYATDWAFTTLRTNLENNSYGSQLGPTHTGEYSNSNITAGDLLFVHIDVPNESEHAYICVGFNNSTGKPKFAEHTINGGSYGKLTEKNISYMNDYSIINMYVAP